MALAIDVVKQAGRRPTERFDPDKLLHSIRAACLSVRSPEGEAEDTAKTVTSAVILWCTTRPTVTTHDIRQLASVHLHQYHPEAAYLYHHHRNII